MNNPKEAALSLASLAKSRKVRFPKIWDDNKIMMDCGKTLMMFRNEDGIFDEVAALASLEENYGLDNVAEDRSVDNDSKKRQKSDEITGSDDEQKKKKVLKSDIVACEENRIIATTIKEMADIYFKNKDARKGGVFSKAAKAIRECEEAIKDKKVAMKLKGVGKGIAGYIEELLQNGSIAKLEELRAGTA